MDVFDEKDVLEIFAGEYSSFVVVQADEKPLVAEKKELEVNEEVNEEEFVGAGEDQQEGIEGDPEESKLEAVE